MIATTVEGRAHHCGQLARGLRPEHAGAIVALGIDPHRELRTAFEASSFARALLLDGRLAALGGVVGPEIASEGHVWLALAAWTAPYRRTLLTEARRALAGLAGTRHAVTTTVLTDDAPALRFARHLCFVMRYFDPPPHPSLIAMRLDLRSLPPWR